MKIAWEERPKIYRRLIIRVGIKNPTQKTQPKNPTKKRIVKKNSL